MNKFIRKFKNRKFPKDFKSVADYIFAKKHIKVSLANSTSFSGHFNRNISVHHNYDLTRNGLYALLHECGHALQPPTSIGTNSYKLIDEDEKPREFQMGRFLNELDAWDRGLKIANELNIEINMKQWNLVKDEALLTYWPKDNK
jgi:hypothetical protein